MENVKEICYDQQFSKDSAKKRNEQRKSVKYCDYVIKTEDGSEFPTHKCILEAASPFFDKMFNSDLNQKEKQSVLLENCSSDLMEKIIEYLYIGNMEITSDIAKETLDTALFLQLYVLVDDCTQVLIETVNTENCFELLSYSETYDRGIMLTMACMQIICDNLKDFLENPTKLVKMSLDSLNLLHVYHTGFYKNEQIFRAIVKWITFDIEKREKFLSALLQKISFQNMSYEFRLNNVLENNPLIYKKDFVNKVTDFLRKDWVEQYSKPKGLYSIIGDHVILYNDETMSFSKKVTKMCNIICNFGYSIFGESNLFICGGITNKCKVTNECNYFSMNENCWNNLPPMKFARSGHHAITLNNKIYSCFGIRKNTVEIFDIYKMQWTMGPAFDEYDFHKGLCHHNENIYSIAPNYFIRLDTRTDKWIELQTPENKILYSMINYNNKIYAFSGENIITYDIFANKWLEDVKFYKVKHQNYNPPLACLINDRIYLLGKTEHGRHIFSVCDPSNLSCLSRHEISSLKNNDIFAFFSI